MQCTVHRRTQSADKTCKKMFFVLIVPGEYEHRAFLMGIKVVFLVITRLYVGYFGRLRQRTSIARIFIAVSVRRLTSIARLFIAVSVRRVPELIWWLG